MNNTLTKKAEIWDNADAVNFYDNPRNKSSDVSPSEWFFLKGRLNEGMSIVDIKKMNQMMQLRQLKIFMQMFTSLRKIIK